MFDQFLPPSKQPLPSITRHSIHSLALRSPPPALAALHAFCNTSSTIQLRYFIQGNRRLTWNYSGKGTPRRKIKKVHKTSGTDDKKLQTALKKLNVQPIQAIEEVNMFKSDGNVIHFSAPKGKFSHSWFCKQAEGIREISEI
jgi:hypothetical protein